MAAAGARDRVTTIDLSSACEIRILDRPNRRRLFPPMSNRALTLVFMTLLATPAFAADGAGAQAQADGGLAIGLHWGMTNADAKQILPQLVTSADMGPAFGEVLDDPKFATVGSAVTMYGGCRIDVTLKFYRDYLDEVRLATDNGAACHREIEDRLIRHYHDPNGPASCPNLIHRLWKDAAETVTYDYDCASANNRMNIQFHQEGPGSGRLADRTSFQRCQHITVDFVPGADADGASNPQLVTDLVELACTDFYPPVSVRLQEQGSVTLTVEILADGTVGDVRLAKTSGKSRLDEAAVALARQKLKFLPAMKDGVAVDARRQVAVTYRLIHLIHGTAMLVARCGDHLVIGGPCQPPVLAMTLAPARNNRPLTISSREFRPGAQLDEDLLKDRKSPALQWSAGPAGTKSYVLISENLRRATGDSDPCVYWLVYDIPASARGLPAGLPTDTRLVNPAGALSAHNLGSTLGCYSDPYASQSRSVHYQVFALDKTIDLDPATSNRAAFIAAMKEHVLASGEVVATYVGP